MNTRSDPKQTQLASNLTVAQYEAACAAEDRHTIAEALPCRFTERYLDPVTQVPTKHGFTMMAISCLMIESLESFVQGWKNSKNKSESAFCSFFDKHDEFDDFRGRSAQFYRNVRCGILHQGETTGGWRITRRSSAPLLDTAGPPMINANVFLKRLRAVLDDFCDELRGADWKFQEVAECPHEDEGALRQLCAVNVERRHARFALSGRPLFPLALRQDA